MHFSFSIAQNFRGSLILQISTVRKIISFNDKFFTCKLQFSCARVSMNNILLNPQGTLSKEIPSSRHCFADSCSSADNGVTVRIR